MAFLWWNADRRELTKGVGNIGALKTVIENELRSLGYADVARSDLDVSANGPGARVSVAHFHIADRLFWEVVITAGDSAEARTVNDQVVGKLRALVFFD